MAWWQWQRMDDRATDLPTFVRKVNDSLLKLTHILRPLEGFLGPNGQAFIGDDANANNTFGLTINQLAADDEILSLKSSDVAHALTSQTETDTYAFLRKLSATLGGLTVRSLAEDDALSPALMFVSFGGTATSTKSSAGRSLIEMIAYEHDGANAHANIAADGNVFGVRALVGASEVTLWLVDEDGDTWQSGSLTHLGRHVSTFQTFAADDATPSVSAGKNFKTANANPTTITAFDDGVDGQEIFVLVNDANTTVDFTGTTLKGNAGADWSPGSGDFMRCTRDGTNWYCTVTDATA
jgi:hypothetical protein